MVVHIYLFHLSNLLKSKRTITKLQELSNSMLSLKLKLYHHMKACWERVFFFWLQKPGKYSECIIIETSRYLVKNVCITNEDIVCAHYTKESRTTL